MNETKSLDPRFSVEIEPGRLDGRIVWEEVFGRQGPVELEIGFGKGCFLMAAPPERPERNYFGIELSRKYVAKSRRKLERLGITNVRIMRHEARYFLERLVSEESLDAIHVYHPDPWPKRRHHKRRLLQAPFLFLCLSKIKPGGVLHLSTDHEDYYGSIREEVRKLEEKAPGIELAFSQGLAGPGEVVTYYARKFAEMGSTIHRIDIRKDAGSD